MKISRTLSHLLFSTILIFAFLTLFFIILFLVKIYPNILMGATSLLVAIKLNNISHLLLENNFYLNLTLTILALAFISSLVIGVIRFFTLNVRTKRFINSNLKSKKSLSLKLKKVTKELEISQISEIRSSGLEIFCFGFFNPRICISSSLVELLSIKELKAVLLHEKEHFKNRDPLRFLIISAFSKILFFLIGLKTLVKKYLVTAEALADQQAIKYFKSKKFLIKALIKILKNPQNSINYPESLGTLNVTEERIDLLANRKNQTPSLKNSLIKFLLSFSIVAFILIFISFGLSFTSCGHPMKCLNAIAQAAPQDIDSFSQIHEAIDSGASCDIDYYCPDKIQSTNEEICTSI